jgi:hypothetical protein
MTPILKRNENILPNRETNLNKSIDNSRSLKLVCKNCLNISMIEGKRRDNSADIHMDPSLTSIKLNNDLHHIYKRVYERQKLSSIASKTLDTFKPSRKEVLQEKNGSYNDFLKTKDHALERAKEKYNKNESYIESHMSKFISGGKNSKTKYYENYVE